MSSDNETAKTSPDSSQDDEVYAKDEEGDPGMVDTSRSEERLAEDGSSRIVHPKVYGGLVLVGAVLLVFQQPTASGIGIGLIVIGLFIGAVDALSRY